MTHLEEMEALKLKPDYSLLHACELNLAGFVFGTYKQRGWTLSELWEKLGPEKQAAMREFVATFPPEAPTVIEKHSDNLQTLT